jgi:hypothetical protein
MGYLVRNNMHRIIPWDSTCFHNTTIETDEFPIPGLKLNKGDLVVIKTSPLDIVRIKSLTKQGFYIVEESVEIAFDLTSWDPKSCVQHAQKGYFLIPAKQKHVVDMQDIARRAFVADRFHLDPHLPKSGANKRYKEWVTTSFNGDDEVFAFVDQDKKVIGFFIVKKTGNTTNLRLAAIDPKNVGKGLGKLLYFSMFRLLKNRGDTKIETQISLNNIPVFNVYTYLVHPKIIKTSIVLHKVIGY